MKLTALVSAAAATALAGCAASTDMDSRMAAGREDGRQCFFSSSVSGFRTAPRAANGSEQIYVDIGSRETYLFQVFGICPNLDFSNNIALVSRTGSNSICGGLDVDLLVPRGLAGPDRCQVRMIRQLTAEERSATRR